MINSIPDLIVIGGAALLVFGPKRLPELAKALGTGIREFKKSVAGIDEELANQKLSKVENVTEVLSQGQESK